MKTIFILLAFIFSSHFILAQTKGKSGSVHIDITKNELTKGDTLLFHVVVQEPKPLEISVFSDSKIVLHENAALTEGTHDYRVLVTSELPTGKYYVLVTGEGIHEQGTLYIR
jgi:hypothetical protein